MEGILCLSDFLNIVGRPAFLACPCCGLSFSNDFLELLIETENENQSHLFSQPPREVESFKYRLFDTID